MNSFSIALKMFRTNLKTYGFYLAVMVFAVAVYYDFMVLKYDPGFLKAQDSIFAAQTAATVTSFVLVVFLAFFVWYSSSFFLKQRKKEIAIYSLLGVSSRKIGRIFAIESLFTGTTSLAAGLGLGILFSRLFLMAVAKVSLLEVEVEFSVPVQGIKELLIVFGSIFLLVSLNNFVSVVRSRLIDLIRDAAKEEREPKFKWVRAILSVLFIGTGYYLCKNIALELIVVPIVVIGTYWFFGALVPAVTKLLTQSKGILYKGVRIISISNISYRIRSNYRSLAMLAVMAATTLTAFGTSLSLKYYVDETHHIDFPYSFSYVLDDEKTDSKVLERIKASRHELLLAERIKYVSTPVSITRSMRVSNGKMLVMGYSEFMKVSGDMESQYPGKVPRFAKIEGNQAIVIISPAMIGGIFEYNGHNAVIGKTKYSIVQEAKAPLFGNGKLYQSECMIIPDKEYEKLIKGKRENVFVGLIVSDAKHSLDLANSLVKLMPKGVSLFTYVTRYMSLYNFMGMFYFLGSFMSIVFILATGSIMYFKILSEGLADRGKYEVLKKIGMTRKEIRKAVSMQVGLSLILPLLVGILHSLFAIDALRILMSYSLTVPAITAIATYVFFYGLFYAATTRKFMKLVY